VGECRAAALLVAKRQRQPERRHTMGDKGAKKDKNKGQKQKVAKKEQKMQKKQDKQQKKNP
jgi:hypothetical protein